MMALKAGAAVLLGMALAAPVWGHSNAEWLAFEADARGRSPHPVVMHPDARPFAPDEAQIEVSRIGGPHSLHVRVRVQGRPEHCITRDKVRGDQNRCSLIYWQGGFGWAFWSMDSDPRVTDWDLERHGPSWWNDFRGPYDLEFVFGVVRYRDGPPLRSRDEYVQYIDAVRHVHYRTPSAPGTEPPTPPPEPEPPEPEPPVPEPDPPTPTRKSIRFNVYSTNPLECAVSYRVTEHTAAWWTTNHVTLEVRGVGPEGAIKRLFFKRLSQATFAGTYLCGQFIGWEREHVAVIRHWSYPDQTWHRPVVARHTTPSEPEPEPPEPEPPPEPEVPDPEEPDHTHPIERCDHVAIVPAMPKALPGGEDAADHWLRISNPGAESITFTVTGRNDAGDPHPRSWRGLTGYRRELPAYKSIQVNMRDVEAAFDVEPEGWWMLTVTGSGPLYASATMLNHGERRFVPVRTPATCPRLPPLLPRTRE